MVSGYTRFRKVSKTPTEPGRLLRWFAIFPDQLSITELEFEKKMAKKLRDDMTRVRRSMTGVNMPTSRRTCELSSAIREVQTDLGVPISERVSILNGQLAGGYYIGMTGTFDMTLRAEGENLAKIVRRWALALSPKPSTASVVRADALRVNFEGYLFDKGATPELAIDDEDPFLLAFERWDEIRDPLKLRDLYRVAAMLFAVGDVVRGRPA
jgi:hypothetical protein